MLIYSIRSCECRTVSDRSAISWGPIGWRLVGDCFFSVCLWLQKGLRLKSVLGLSAITATCRRPVPIQWPTSPQPPCDHQKLLYDRFGRREISLATNKTSFRPNRHCDLPATCAICRRPVGDRPPASLQPPYDRPKQWSQGGHRQVASYVWPGTLLAKSNGRFFVLDFLKLSNRRNVFNFGDNKDR